MAIFGMMAPGPEGPTGPTWLRWVRTAPGAPVLICLPHAGGSVLSCLGLAAVLPSDLAIATVALPGHEFGSPPVAGDARAMAGAGADALSPVADVRRLAATLAAEISRDLGTALAPSGAGITLLGNSFGALLAYETALALEQSAGHDAPRLHLVVSGFRSPSRAPLEAPLHRLPRAVLLAELRECFGAVGPDLGDRLGAREEAALRADLEACETYRPRGGPLLRSPVSVIRLARDPSVSAAEYAAWDEVCAGPIGRHTLMAGHFPWSGATAAFARLIDDLIVRQPGSGVAASAAGHAAPPPSVPPL